MYEVITLFLQRHLYVLWRPMSGQLSVLWRILPLSCCFPKEPLLSSGLIINYSLLLDGIWCLLTHQRANTTTLHVSLLCRSGKRIEYLTDFHFFPPLCSNSQHFWKNMSTLQRLGSTICLKPNNGRNYEASVSKHSHLLLYYQWEIYCLHFLQV